MDVDNGPGVNDDDSALVEPDDLRAWWAGLSDSERFEAYGIGPQTPMPAWMYASLVAAGIQDSSMRQTDQKE